MPFPLRSRARFMSISPRPPSALTPTEFITLYGGVYEHSQWVAEEIAKAGSL